MEMAPPPLSCYVQQLCSYHTCPSQLRLQDVVVVVAIELTAAVSFRAPGSHTGMGVDGPAVSLLLP